MESIDKHVFCPCLPPVVFGVVDRAGGLAVFKLSGHHRAPAACLGSLWGKPRDWAPGSETGAAAPGAFDRLDLDPLPPLLPAAKPPTATRHSSLSTRAKEMQEK